MSAPLLPITPDIFPAEVSFRDFSAGDELAPAGGISIRTARLRHPGGATGYRVDHGGRSICYVTDTEHEPGEPDENILALVDGADIVIYDAMFTDEELPRHRGWGHSTWEEGRAALPGGGGPDVRDLPPRLRIATTRRSTGSERRRGGCSRARWWPGRGWFSLPEPAVPRGSGLSRGGSMEHSIYRYVIRHSLRAQVLLTLLAVASFPFLYAFYELPKQIVNRVIQGDTGDFPAVLLGILLHPATSTCSSSAAGSSSWWSSTRPSST